MAGRILGPWNPARKPSGAADVGAKLFFFENHTTTPVSVFNGPDVATSLGTSLTADANGLFPTFWSAAPIRVRWVDSDGVQIMQVDDVEPGGAASNTFAYDFGTDGRLQAYGQGGVVHFEGGNPSPSDTGGDLRIGGWDNTALETLELDATTVTAGGVWTFTGSASFTGEPLFGGKQVGSVLLASGTALAATEVEIDLTPMAGYGWVELSVVLNAPAGPSFRLSSNGGTSYVATSNYNTNYMDFPSTITSTSAQTSASLVATSAFSMRSNEAQRRVWRGLYDSSGGLPSPFSWSLDTAADYNRLKISLSSSRDVKWALTALRGIGV